MGVGGAGAQSLAIDSSCPPKTASVNLAKS